METPAMLREMGNSSIFASLAEPPGPNQPLELSMSYLKFSRGACRAPARGAAAAGEGAASDAAAMPAAASDAPPSRSRRVQPELLRFSWLIIFLRRVATLQRLCYPTAVRSYGRSHGLRSVRKYFYED